MHHYTLSALDNIWITNGYEWVDTAYGKALRVPKVEELHHAIGRALIAQPRLSGREFRWLRVAMDLSQAALGKMFGVTDQAVAKWEKGRGAPKLADRTMRALYAEYLDGHVTLAHIFSPRSPKTAAKPARESAKPARLVFTRTSRGWRQETAHAKRAA